MTELLPSQQALRDRILGIVDDPQSFRSRTFLLIGEAGTGKTFLAKALANGDGFDYCNLADISWSAELLDPAKSHDFVKKLIRQRATRANLLLDGITPLYLMHKLDWCRRLITALSELAPVHFAFVILTIGDVPGSPHPLRDSVENWFADEDRLLSLKLTYEDLKEYCARSGKVLLSGVNLHEIQLTS